MIKKIEICHNFYRHIGCIDDFTKKDIEWDDPDCDSEHNDHCPICDAEIEPYESEWYEVENET